MNGEVGDALRALRDRVVQFEGVVMERLRIMEGKVEVLGVLKADCDLVGGKAGYNYVDSLVEGAKQEVVVGVRRSFDDVVDTLNMSLGSLRALIDTKTPLVEFEELRAVQAAAAEEPPQPTNPHNAFHGCLRATPLRRHPTHIPKLERTARHIRTATKQHVLNASDPSDFQKRSAKVASSIGL